MADLTPEHTKRSARGLGINGEIVAAYRYVDSVVDTADICVPFLAWHGWALREAFLAGCSYRAERGEGE